jgi:hypothetical protein
MTSQIGIIYQIRRGTSAQVAAFTPAQGEMVGDMTLLREVVGDGSQIGGFPVGKASVKALVDSSVYTVTSNDVLVFYTLLSTVVGHTIFLPPANTYPAGQELRIQDASSGLGGSSIPITVNASTTPNADSINSTTTISFNGAGVGRTLISNGSTGWFSYST